MPASCRASTSARNSSGARAGSVRPDDWHLAHLYAPRSVVADSVMPAYRSLFDGGA